MKDESSPDPIPSGADATVTPSSGASGMPSARVRARRRTRSERVDRDSLVVRSAEVIEAARADAAALERAIARVDREPFRRLLAAFLQGAPRALDVRAQAERYPDRYVQALTQLARLAGYRDTHVSVSVTADLSALSDVELEARVRELERQLAETRVDVRTE